MPILEIVLLGLALSMDAFAVTLSDLIAYPKLARTKKFALPLVFGVFQGLMPLIGYFVGSLAADIINTFAGPLALILLGFIGGKMVLESVLKLRAAKKKDGAGARQEAPLEAPLEAPPEAPFVASPEAPFVASLEAPPEAPSDAAVNKAALSYPTILLQGIATSIDALIVGITLLAMGANIALASSVIALTTCVCCFIALVLGKRLGELLGDKAQVIGGLVLIAIGIKACFF